MSGKPYPEGIAEIREHLRTMSALALEAKRLSAEREQIDARLVVINDENFAAWKAAFALVGKMDVTQSGNFGHEGRFSYFLRELVAPTEAPEAQHIAAEYVAPPGSHGHTRCVPPPAPTPGVKNG